MQNFKKSDQKYKDRFKFWLSLLFSKFESGIHKLSAEREKYTLFFYNPFQDEKKVKRLSKEMLNTIGILSSKLTGNDVIHGQQKMQK